MPKELYRTSNYRIAQVERIAAYAQYNWASTNLEFCKVKEREAELGSQSFEFVANGKLFERLGKLSDKEREIGLAFARYAVYGRTDE